MTNNKNTHEIQSGETETSVKSQINEIWKPPMIWFSFFFFFFFFFLQSQKNKTNLSISGLNKALVVEENLLALCGWLHVDSHP